MVGARWVHADFDSKEVERIADWIDVVTDRDDVDRDMISLIGFSAGAYSATEILASGRACIHSMMIGAVHGHGPPGSMSNYMGS